MNSNPRTILVTGATGNLGRSVVVNLRARRVLVKAGVRNPGRVSRQSSEEHEVVHLDFNYPPSFSPALSGVQAVLLLRPPAISKVENTLNLFVDEAAEAGVEHVVFLSVAGADRAKFIPHAKVEAHLRK